MKLGMGRPRVEAEMGVVPKVRGCVRGQLGWGGHASRRRWEWFPRCVVVLEDSLDGALDQGPADSAALPLPLLPNPQLLGYLCNVHAPVEFPSSLPTFNSICLLP